jgi:hypothetical protein
MFRYVMRCRNAHKFEAWLGDEPEPRRLEKLQSTACPTCELVARKTADAEAASSHWLIDERASPLPMRFTVH